MDDVAITDICMRIAEYNLRANHYFQKGITDFSIKERKDLEIERERLTTYVHSKYPMVKIEKYLRRLRKYDEEGNQEPDMPNDINKLAKLLKDGTSKQTKKNIL